MAIRLLRYNDDPILRKKSKEIKEITPQIEELAEDMVNTLEQYDGVGLAGPQVGVLKRIIVVLDTKPNEENEEETVVLETIVAINPKIIDQEGELTQIEACLSFPEKFGKVTRPEKVRVSYTDLENNHIERDFVGLTARCFCHEIDHLDGIVFLDHVIEGTLNSIGEDEKED